MRRNNIFVAVVLSAALASLGLSQNYPPQPRSSSLIRRRSSRIHSSKGSNLIHKGSNSRTRRINSSIRRVRRRKASRSTRNNTRSSSIRRHKGRNIRLLGRASHRYFPHSNWSRWLRPSLFIRTVC
jgi:hypothetical protein